MKRFSEQLKKKADSLRMRADEKAQLRERLLSFMEYHPVTPGLNVRDVKIQAEDRVLRWDAWLVARFAGSVAALVLVVVPALAESSLPGETLYPIKVRFNEEIRGAMNSSPYARVEWEKERLERRLAEAEVLAEAGRLTPEVEAEVAKAIKQHSQSARDNIEVMRADDNDEATMAEISLASALDVSAEIITKREQTTGPSVLSGAVNEARAAVSPREENLSFDRLLSKIESETTRAYEYLGTIDKSISSAERTDINRRLVDVKMKVEMALAKKESDQVAASKQLAEALGNTSKIITFMTNLEVRKNITIEDIVPIEPTAEEKTEVLKQKLADATRITTAVKTSSGKMATTSNDYLAINDTLRQYGTLETEAKAALDSGDVPKAEVAVGAALELARALKETMIGLGFSVSTSTATSTPTSR